MDLGPKLILKQSQKLVMTPALQMAIKLLPLARLELINTIRQELNENPLLEEESTLSEEMNTLPEKKEDSANKEDENDTGPEIDWETYIQNSIDESGSIGEYRESPPIENTIKQTTSLAEHLEWQLDLSAKTDIEKEIGKVIIGNINNEGYLSSDIKEIAELNFFKLSDVKKVLELIQSFDPSGIGVYNLKESLLLQIEHRGMKGSLSATLIKNYIENLEERHYESISKKLDVSINEIIKAVKFIKELSPNPAARFYAEDTHYITPDVIIVKGIDGYQVVLNEGGIPRLKINSFYRKILQNKKDVKSTTKEYVENKFRSALWLIKSIEQRRDTILKVSKSIVKFQKGFLDNGIEYLKPLILKDVAIDIEMHESTISRVTTNKYMHTPQGLFEFKYFFHSSIGSEFGNTTSSVSVKNMMKNMIADENPREPITDLTMVNMLKTKDIHISRRTITKYRKELKITSASKRKKIFI